MPINLEVRPLASADRYAVVAYLTDTGVGGLKRIEPAAGIEPATSNCDLTEAISISTADYFLERHAQFIYRARVASLATTKGQEIYRLESKADTDELAGRGFQLD